MGKFLQRGAHLNGGWGRHSVGVVNVRVCVDNVWGAGAVQDQVPYSHGLLLRQLCFFKLRGNSNMPYM